MIDISLHIKNIRKSKGFSQQDIADKIGINRVQYTRIETGKSEPTLNMLQRIALALEVDLINLIEDNQAIEVDSSVKSLSEKIKLISELDQEQQRSIFTFIDTAIANKRLKNTLSNALNGM
ncbi:XRE family transcriptional regulator [Apibacter muscae]|uniref:XRE family transcriptional regulator n=1 Tax=Apibacter muscae TaxID=2509004 RepID=A0A563DLT3_9FLAO|nr:helix-turn-helix transcriptional regulator [Apibacter muscae]TWP30774.1 XRE family transcriptional regulator [Apibacter muscae]